MLDVWRQALEVKGFSRTKTEYLSVKSNDITHETGAGVKMDTRVILEQGCFKYLGSTIQGAREIDDDVTHRIRARGKMEACLQVLHNTNMSPRLKFYIIMIRTTLLFRAQ